MKKIYFFLSAACLAASASAVQKDLATRQMEPIKAETVQSVKSFAGEAKAAAVFDKTKKLGGMTRADENPVLALRPAYNVMSFGPNPNGQMYAGMGFASSYGNVNFYSISNGIDELEWFYCDLNDYEPNGDNLKWHEKSSKTTDLSIKSGLGFFPAPYLLGYFGKDNQRHAYTNWKYIYCGGGADYYINGNDTEVEDAFGVTFYQNVGLVDGKNSGYTTYSYKYAPNTDGYDENGVCTKGNDSWKSTLESAWFKGKTVSDIKFNNFTVIQPKPVSTYMMTRGWIWMNVEVSAATQLISYIYPIDEVDEEGYIEEMPIAIGYASIPAGGTDTPIFYYYPLNEDGDEIEDVVYIDSAVAITFEGFADNDAVKVVQPVSGFYPFNYPDYKAGFYDVCVDADLYINFSLKADDQEYNDVMVYSLGLYGFGDDENVLTSLNYAQFTTDATFAYIHSVDDTYSVTIPKEGGEASVVVEALYYNILKLSQEGVYEIKTPDWVSLEIGEANASTGETTLIVSANAGEDRTGYITIEGMGATYTLQVNQGEGAAVSTIAVDKNAEYYDLAGRRVSYPEKGIYIKKTGNKAEKVLF